MKQFLIFGILPLGVLAAGIDAGQYDPLMAEKSAIVDTDGIKWIDGRHLPLEGKAFVGSEGDCPPVLRYNSGGMN